MKIAIYNGFNFHFEMIGFAIDYCKSRGFEFDILNDSAGFDWLPFYKRTFGDDIEFYHCNTIVPDKYDWIILLTDDDNTLSDDVIQNNVKKVICIDHMCEIRRTLPKYHVKTRDFLLGKECNLWALPVFSALSEQDKKQNLLGNNKRCVITMLGFSSIPENIQQIKNEFGQYFYDYDFQIINRKNDLPEICEPNVRLFTNIPTDMMISLLDKTTHIFLRDRWPWYITELMSAAIPIAFSFGCQLIMPQNWFDNYMHLGSSVKVYKDIPLGRLTYEDYENVLPMIFDTRQKLIEHRNHVFDSIISNV